MCNRPPSFFVLAAAAVLLGCAPETESHPSQTGTPQQLPIATTLTGDTSQPQTQNGTPITSPPDSFQSATWVTSSVITGDVSQFRESRITIKEDHAEFENLHDGKVMETIRCQFKIDLTAKPHTIEFIANDKKSLHGIIEFLSDNLCRLALGTELEPVKDFELPRNSDELESFHYGHKTIVYLLKRQ